MLPVVKTLWVGGKLSPMEHLALASFVACGHRMELFTYEDVQNVPSGVVIRDGNDILNESLIFRYTKGNSVACFTDWFRYEMLYKEGGIWVDTDVICIKPIDFSFELFFGKEDWNVYNGAILGAIPEQKIIRFLGDQAASPNDFLPYDTFRDKRRKLKRKYLQGNKQGNIKWGETGPDGLTKAVKYMGLENHALPHTYFYPIHSKCWYSIFDETFSSFETHFPDTYAIHLWNEMMKRKPGFDKNGSFPENSLIEQLKRRYLK